MNRANAKWAIIAARRRYREALKLREAELAYAISHPPDTPFMNMIQRRYDKRKAH